MKHRVSRVNAVTLIKVIEVRSLTGYGGKNDPIRELREYYSVDDGLLLARVDGNYSAGPVQRALYDDEELAAAPGDDD